MSVRRRAFAAAALLAACLLPAAFPAAGAARALPGRQRPPLATVRVVDCAPEDGRAVFHARMRAIPRSARMAMRLTLLERLPGGWRFRPVHAPGLDRWRSSRPGVRSFGLRQAVRNLAPGAAYRLQASLRWLGRRGAVLRRARRRSPPCRDPALLPNLRVRLLGAAGAGMGEAIYSVGVGNVGTAPSPPAELELALDWAPLGPVGVPALAPGTWRRLDLRGPRCADAAVATVDPGDAVVELDEADNAHERDCLELLP